MKGALLASLLLSLLLAACFPGPSAQAPLRVVGSGTVFPFSIAVAEAFSETKHFRTPVVESTGTGVGIKVFCSGNGADTPEVVNASRPMTQAEEAQCHANGVTPVPFKIGYDGIVVVQALGGPFSSVTCKTLFQALGKYQLSPEGDALVPNRVKTWRQVDKAMPSVPVLFYGPSSVSGTREVFMQLCMETGALKVPGFEKLKKQRPALFKKAVSTLREDGAYVEVGDNFNLTLEKLRTDSLALGVVGYNYYALNGDLVSQLVVDGSRATVQSIRNRSYVLSRPLFFYAKKEHAAKNLALVPYTRFFLSDAMIGDAGTLATLGLAPMLPQERAEQRSNLRQLGA